MMKINLEVIMSANIAVISYANLLAIYFVVGIGRLGSKETNIPKRGETGLPAVLF